MSRISVGSWGLGVLSFVVAASLATALAMRNVSSGARAAEAAKR
ncbi:MAG TPA: hypothetical protein VN818_04850 [Gammaproteobacteria bacterium]|nr:hypothetical protein [Gammaproteobacteria bacterium]